MKPVNHAVQHHTKQLSKVKLVSGKAIGPKICRVLAGSALWHHGLKDHAQGCCTATTEKKTNSTVMMPIADTIIFTGHT